MKTCRKFCLTCRGAGRTQRQKQWRGQDRGQQLGNKSGPKTCQAAPGLTRVMKGEASVPECIYNGLVAVVLAAGMLSYPWPTNCPGLTWLEIRDCRSNALCSSGFLYCFMSSCGWGNAHGRMHDSQAQVPCVHLRLFWTLWFSFPDHLSRSAGNTE